MRNQIASIGINQSEETYLLAPKSLYKGEPLSLCRPLGHYRRHRTPRGCRWSQRGCATTSPSCSFEFHLVVIDNNIDHTAPKDVILTDLDNRNTSPHFPQRGPNLKICAFLFFHQELFKHIEMDQRSKKNWQVLSEKKKLIFFWPLRAHKCQPEIHRKVVLLAWNS